MMQSPVTRAQARLSVTPQSNRKRGLQSMDTDETENNTDQEMNPAVIGTGSHSKRKRANWDIKKDSSAQKQLVDAVRGAAGRNSATKQSNGQPEFVVPSAAAAAFGSAVKSSTRQNSRRSSMAGTSAVTGSAAKPSFKVPSSAGPARRTPRRQAAVAAQLRSGALRTNGSRPQSMRKQAAAAAAAAHGSQAPTPISGTPRASLQFQTPSLLGLDSPASYMETPPLVPADADIDQLRMLVEDKENELVVLRERHAALVDEMNEAKEKGMVFGGDDAASLQRQVDEQSETIVKQKAELLHLKEKLASIDSELARVRGELRNVKRQMADAVKAKASAEKGMVELKQERSEQQQAIVDLRTAIREHCEEIRALKLRAEADAQTRRELHNKIQELKGNIRVYCRVRPLSEEDATDSSHGFEFPSEESIRLLSTVKSNIGRGSQLKQHQFDFNRVFGPASTQEETFAEISGLVQSALDGFNVCVFAYGQTGAGKTFTMEGPNVADCDPYSRGVIPRAVEQIFSYAAEQQQRGWRFEIKASFLEIYQEEVYDLLTSTQSRTKSRPHLEIRQQRDGSVIIPSLTVEKVEDAEAVQGYLERAAMVRATTATKMNDRSSRSHSVFQMRLEGFNEESGMSTCGVLNLVDLAGSERVSRSGASGEQFNEAKAINKSLTTLGGVIRALAEKSAHIPYRNSKLTRILEPYLGGNSKTLMFVNISPSSADSNESLNSLRFAETVSNVQIGKATRQVTQ